MKFLLVSKEHVAYTGRSFSSHRVVYHTTCATATGCHDIRHRVVFSEHSGNCKSDEELWVDLLLCEHNVLIMNTLSVIGDTRLSKDRMVSWSTTCIFRRSSRGTSRVIVRCLCAERPPHQDSRYQESPTCSTSCVLI